MTTLDDPAEVFYSYADADMEFLQRLEEHLRMLQRARKISTWHGRQITAGKDWKAELDDHLNTASLILLLISSDFLACDYQYGVELQRAMERHEANEARVIPILLRSCNWKLAPFAHLQVMPRNQKPIALWKSRDQAFTEVTKEIQAALEELQSLAFGGRPTPLPRIWQIPYQRNPVFTGREELLDKLQDLLQTKRTATLSQTQAISGLGGVGKTQLAVEYAYRSASHYQAVFWINAETQETLTSGYAGLAGELNLSQKDEQDQQVSLQAVRRWLQTHRDWLLILDNVDDLALLPPLLPQSSGGHILLTTRSQMTGRFVHRLDLSPFTSDDGTLLLLRRSGIIAEQATLAEARGEEIALARQVSLELGHLPLALDQAGAYIDETRCSLERYQQQYRQRRAVLLARRGQLTTDYAQSVATTWSLSFEKVEQRAPLAAQILRFCSFLAPEGIPEKLVNHALASGLLAVERSETEEAWQEEQLDELVAVLRAYSLIERTAQERTLAVHRLVQAVLRDALSEEERHAWAERTVKLLSEDLPAITFENWQQCERYIPHAQESVLLLTRSSVEQGRVLHWIGAYLLERQRTQEASWYVQQALQLRELHRGKEDLETAASLDRLARWWELQGRYGEAEPLYKRALSISEQQLGAEHPSTATSLNNLAYLYQQQGRYGEAEPLYKRVVSIFEQQLGAEHPSTATSLNNLAYLYQQQGRYGEAEPLYKRALSISEQQLGAEHPSTATSLNNLAVLYYSQGNYSEAESSLKLACLIWLQRLGEEHPTTQQALSSYAILRQTMEREAETEKQEKKG